MRKWFTATWTAADGFTEIEQPDEFYYADPFVLDGFLFVEQYDQKKGVIAVRPISGGSFTVVLEEPYHLSFPCVFKDDDDRYMIPESGINRTVDLYKATEFPYKWEKVKTILEGSNWADPIIHRENGNWYLFVTPADNTLQIYRAKSLTDDFERIHSDDHMHSRSAGKLFKMYGKLVRPVQNGDPVYGSGIIFKQITIEPYSEKVIGAIKPDWAEGLIGTHTVNSEGGIVVIDGKRNAKTLDSN